MISVLICSYWWCCKLRSFARKTFEFERRFRMYVRGIMFHTVHTKTTSTHSVSWRRCTNTHTPAKGGRHAEEIEIWVWPSSSWSLWAFQWPPQVSVTPPWFLRLVEFSPQCHWWCTWYPTCIWAQNAVSPSHDGYFSKKMLPEVIVPRKHAAQQTTDRTNKRTNEPRRGCRQQQKIPPTPTSTAAHHSTQFNNSNNNR